MSFGAEFRNMKNAGGAPKIMETASREAESVANQTPQEPQGETNPDQSIDGGHLEDGAILELSGEPDISTPPIIPPPKPEVKKVAVKINGKTFESIEEATEYAAQIERELERKEAFEKGQESAKPKETVTPVAEVKKIKKIADMLFENPDGAMEKLEELINEMADKKYRENDTQKTEAQLKAEQIKTDTDNFYKMNSDLADWQDEVNVVVNRNWATLQNLPKEQIITETARLAREYVASVKEKALPRQSLPSKTAQTAGSGVRTTTATTTPATERKVSFAEQVRKAGKRSAVQPET
jgi:hypothetical protein